jgi:hypothetical protein
VAGFFEGDGFNFAGVDVGHAALDFFVPGGFDGGIVGFVEAFDEGAGEVSAFRDGKGKSFFQKFGGFLGHTVIITRNMVVHVHPPKGERPKRDFSLRRPTRSQEANVKGKASACCARNDSWVPRGR